MSARRLTAFAIYSGFFAMAVFAADGAPPAASAEAADDSGQGTGLRGDPCADALYSNLEFDGVDGISSEDGGGIGWIVSWTADDAAISEPSEVLGFYWYTLDSKSLEPSGADYAVWSAQEDCEGPSGLDVPIHAADNVAFAARESDGQELFGYRIWLNRVNTTEPHVLNSGSYYFGLRLQMDATQRSFRPTAAGQNCSAYFQSDFFGYSQFTEVGADVSFCLLGRVLGEPVGACCDDSRCSVTTQADCEEAGNAYQGDGTDCSPNPCPGAPGACCLADGQCNFVSKEECAELGGEFLGGDVRCTSGLCPIPDYCGGEYGDVLYNNIVFDGKNAFWNVWFEDKDFKSLNVENVADVHNSYTEFEIQAIHYYQATRDGFDYAERGRYAVYAADGPGGSPGTNLADVTHVPEFRVDTGELLMDHYPIYLHSLTNLSTLLNSGAFWVGARPEFPTFVGVGTYILTANPIDREAFGRGDGGSWDGLFEFDGRPIDITLCIVGRVGGERTGRCCLDGDCFQVTRGDCDVRGGDYGGDGSRCDPDVCPGAPAACCLEDQSCEELKPGDCSAKGGQFMGQGVSCTGILCRRTACNSPDSIYSNGTWDGQNGYSARRWTGGRYDSVTASDFSVAADVTLTRVSFLTLDDAASVVAADVLVLPRDGCKPDEANETWYLDQTYERFDTGEIALDRYPIYLYNVDTRIDLPAGDWFVGARPVVDRSSGSTYNATAAIVDCQDVWRGLEFGVPSFITVGYDFAFCFAAEVQNPCEGILCGDSNGSGAVDFDDIDCFVAALIGADNWVACGTQQPGGAYVCANDTNGDQAVDFDDIDGFVFAVINGECPYFPRCLERVPGWKTVASAAVFRRRIALGCGLISTDRGRSRRIQTPGRT